MNKNEMIEELEKTIIYQQKMLHALKQELALEKQEELISTNTDSLYHIKNGLITDKSGNKFWYKDGLYHREDGPAIQLVSLTKAWYINGKLHRLDGPAIEYANGDKKWYKDDLLHREDGPAVEWANGDKEWFIENKIHRVDGPAFEYANGDKEWYYQDERIECSSQQEFEKLIKLRIFW